MPIGRRAIEGGADTELFHRKIEHAHEVGFERREPQAGRQQGDPSTWAKADLVLRIVQRAFELQEHVVEHFAAAPIELVESLRVFGLEHRELVALRIDPAREGQLAATTDRDQTAIVAHRERRHAVFLRGMKRQEIANRKLRSVDRFDPEAGGLGQLEYVANRALVSSHDGEAAYVGPSSVDGTVAHGDHGLFDVKVHQISHRPAGRLRQLVFGNVRSVNHVKGVVLRSKYKYGSRTTKPVARDRIGQYRMSVNWCSCQKLTAFESGRAIDGHNVRERQAVGLDRNRNQTRYLLPLATQR